MKITVAATPNKTREAIYPPDSSFMLRLKAKIPSGATSSGPKIAPKVPPSTTFEIAAPRFPGGLTSAAAKRPNSMADCANPIEAIPVSMSVKER